MRILDAAIHGWDLERAIGADETLGDDAGAFLLADTAALDLDSQRHALAPSDGGVPGHASPRDRLLRRFGRHPNITEEVR